MSFNNTSSNNKQFKVLLLGDAGSGKTNFINRIIKGEFQGRYLPTLGVEVTNLDVVTNNGKFNLAIWDISGQNKYCDKSNFYKNADVGLIFFDVTSKISFSNIGNWINDFKCICPNSPIIIVGNKVDIIERKITSNMVYKKYSTFDFIEISTKTCYNFETPINKLLQILTYNYELIIEEKNNNNKYLESQLEILSKL
jgi:GTP-binding nuclear protein Ran